MPVLYTIQKLPLIHRNRATLPPHLPTKPIRQISHPITFILTPILLIHKLSLALSLLIFQLPLVIPPVRTDEPAFSMRDAVLNVPYVVAAIGVDHLAPAMGHAVLPLAVLPID